MKDKDGGIGDHFASRYKQLNDMLMDLEIALIAGEVSTTEELKYRNCCLDYMFSILQEASWVEADGKKLEDIKFVDERKKQQLRKN